MPPIRPDLSIETLLSLAGVFRDRTGVMSLLRERGFLLLCVGEFLNIVATWSLRTVLLIWVYTLTRSGVAVALVGLAEALPLLVLGPVAGVYVDRWNRAFTMAGASLATAVLVLPLLTVNGRSMLPMVVLIAILANACGQLFMTAAGAAVPVVVGKERAGEANSLLSVMTGIVAVAGPGLAALIFSTVGPHGAVIACAIVFALAAPILILVPAPRAAHGADTNTTVRREMIDGVHYVRRSSLLTSLIVIAFIALLGIGALTVLDVVFVTRALHLRSASVGVLLSSSGVGELTGGVAMSILASRVSGSYHRLLGSSIIVSAVAFGAYALSPTLWFAAAALFVVGLMLPPLIVSFTTMMQIVTDNAYMGRVNSVINTAVAVAMIVSLIAGGTLADLFGVRQVIGGAAMMFGVSGVYALVTIRTTPVTFLPPPTPLLVTVDARSVIPHQDT